MGVACGLNNPMPSDMRANRSLPALLILAVAGILLIAGCDQTPLDDDFKVAEPNSPTPQVGQGFTVHAPYYGSGPMLELGEPLENAYHIDTVRRAYAGLVGRSAETVAEEVPVTHHYVRFLPATVDEVDVLNNET